MMRIRSARNASTDSVTDMDKLRDTVSDVDGDADSDFDGEHVLLDRDGETDDVNDMSLVADSADSDVDLDDDRDSVRGIVKEWLIVGEMDDDRVMDWAVAENSDVWEFDVVMSTVRVSREPEYEALNVPVADASVSEMSRVEDRVADKTVLEKLEEGDGVADAGNGETDIVLDIDAERVEDRVWLPADGVRESVVRGVMEELDDSDLPKVSEPRVAVGDTLIEVVGVIEGDPAVLDAVVESSRLLVVDTVKDRRVAV